jgi:hypothetical protein
MFQMEDLVKIKIIMVKGQLHEIFINQVNISVKVVYFLDAFLRKMIKF